MTIIKMAIPDHMGDNPFPDVTIIGNSHIEQGAKIGAGTVVYPGCYIFSNVQIGENCLIKPNTVIGGNGFVYPRDSEGTPMPVQWSGSVMIGDDVHIGSGTCIDRGIEGVTCIGRYTRIDNLCQIAHDVSIGTKVIIASGTIIGGYAEIRDNARIALQNTVRNRIVVGRGAMTGMHSSITRNVPDGWSVAGRPAKRMLEQSNL